MTAGKFDPILMSPELRGLTGVLLQRFLLWCDKNSDVMDPAMIQHARESGIALSAEMADDLAEMFLVTLGDVHQHALGAQVGELIAGYGPHGRDVDLNILGTNIVRFIEEQAQAQALADAEGDRAAIAG